MMFRDIISIAIPLIFFFINIVWTQIIYKNKHLILWTFFSLLLPAALFYFAPETSRVQVSNLSMLLFCYFILLVIIRKTYKRVNNFFVQKDLVGKGYADKDFTYVQWNSSNPTSGDWWDEKRAKKPSWFDHLLTFLLLTLPFLAVTLMYTLIENVS